MIADLKPYPAMKDSGVPWLGEVPEHWEIERLKARAANIIEQTDERPSGGLYVALEHVESWTGRLRDAGSETSFESQVKRFRPDDVLFGKLRPYLAKVARPTREGVCVGEFFVLRSTANGVGADYLARLLRSKSIIDTIDASTFGAKMPRADWHFVGNLALSFPPLPEQASIVRFLDHADRRIRRCIRAKQRLIKLLEEQKQAIIHSAVTRGLDPNVRFKPSGVEWLGEVPEHWKVKRLKNVSPGITVGVVVNPSSYFQETGVPILLGNNVLPGRFRLDEVRRISPESNEALRKSQLRTGDVVVVRVGAPGVAAVITDELDGCNCASMVIVRRGRDYEPRWMEHLFNSAVMRRQIDVVKYGAAQKQFNIAHAVEFLAILPSIEEQRLILIQLEGELAAQEAAISVTHREISLLREYRTCLIADVVTGKLDVRAAAARLPDETDESEAPDDSEGLADGDEDTTDGDLGAAQEEAEA